jgi:hypothetical protein
MAWVDLVTLISSAHVFSEKELDLVFGFPPEPLT